MLHSSIGIGIG